MVIYANAKVLLLFLNFVIFVECVYSHRNSDSGVQKSNIIHGRYTRDISDFHIVVPQKVHPDGSFHSYYLPHYFKSSVRHKRNLEDERVHYLLQFNGSSQILELEPNAHITSPGMVVEKRSKGSDITGVTFEKPHKHLCHFRGSVRDQPDSSAAISGCDGLVGYIRTTDGIFFIEPLHGDSPEEGKEHVHVVYKRSASLPGRSCNVKGDWWGMWCSRLQSALKSKTSAPHKRSETGVSIQRYYELMIAADNKFLMFHKDRDVQEYIICIMNMVADFYHDASVGNLIDVVIVRIVYLEKEEEEIDLQISADAEDTLESFCKWQYNLNPKDINHPNHHDTGVLLTRYDICSDDDDESCGLLGLAHLGTACTKEENCLINEDGGLQLGVVVTHELGHTLSCSHDHPDENGCEGKTPQGDSTVMSPSLSTQTGGWSPCSKAFITGLLDAQLGECMLDEPTDHSYPFDEMPAGAFYDADQQCAFLFGPNFIHKNLGGDKFCQKLWCRKSVAASAFSNGVPPADGTSCGTNRWCYDKRCVELGERPTAVNGEWGAWGEWSECSRTCGGGVSMKERHCDNPQPIHKGRYCQGKRTEYTMCNTQKCEGATSTYREEQCTDFNNKPFLGELRKWKPHPPPDSDPNPCALFCLNNANEFTKLAPRVKDGTRCKRGTLDTCIQGACLPVGCDWKIGSDAVEDICGICNGDGTHCNITEGVFNSTAKTGYAPIVTAPVGAVNVKLTENEAGENMIAVSSTNNTYYLNGKYTEQLEGEYDFGGVKGIYSKPIRMLEELHIRGPIKEPLVLYAVLFSKVNPGVRYSFSVPTDKPVYTPKYHWEFVEWSSCSAICGGGTQVMVGSCIEDRNGKVRDTFCENLPKGDPRARSCNNQPCRTRWKVWKWGPCSGCIFQYGTRTRKVECVRENPTKTSDEEIIADPAECSGPPPTNTSVCKSSQPCPKNTTSEIVKRKIIEEMPIEELIDKRDNEGKSFNDGEKKRTTPLMIRDKINPDFVHFEEALLEDRQFNVSEQIFQEVGDEIPDKILSCPIQNLTGKEAIKRLEEILSGEGYRRNTTKINNKTKSDKASNTTRSTKLSLKATN